MSADQESDEIIVLDDNFEENEYSVVESQSSPLPATEKTATVNAEDDGAIKEKGNQDGKESKREKKEDNKIDEHALVDNSDEELPEGEYVVEDILDKKPDPRKKGSYLYLVKWKGYDHDANTWEPPKNLTHCQDLMAEFEKKRQREKEAKKKTPKKEEKGKRRKSTASTIKADEDMDEVKEAINAEAETEAQSKENAEPEKQRGRCRKKENENTSNEQPNLYDIEKIIDTKVDKNGRALYKVHWKGYPVSQATWEPAEHLQGCEEHINAFVQQQNAKKRKVDQGQQTSVKKMRSDFEIVGCRRLRVKGTDNLLCFKIRCLASGPDGKPRECYLPLERVKELNPYKLVDFLVTKLVFVGDKEEHSISRSTNNNNNNNNNSADGCTLSSDTVPQTETQQATATPAAN